MQAPSATLQIAATRSFSNYEPRAITKPLLAELRDAVSKRYPGVPNAIILRLECYLQITSQVLTRADLEPPAIDKLKGFVGAIYSSRFGVNQGYKSNLNRQVQILLHALGADDACRSLAKMTSRRDGAQELTQWIDKFQSAQLDQDRVRFWQGWNLRNRVGNIQKYQLHSVFERFGRAFTDQLFTKLGDWQQGQVRVCPFVEQFALHLTTYDTAINFQDPQTISDIMREFLVNLYTSRYESGFTTYNTTRALHKLLSYLRGHVFGTIWAEPLPRIPIPIADARGGTRTHIHRTPDGFEVTNGLVTEIPLHITDSKAIEEILHGIQKDVDYLTTWARSEISLARNRVLLRKALSAKGRVSQPSGLHQSASLCNRLRRDCPEHLAHAAATYEALGFTHFDKRPRLVMMSYPLPLSQTTWELGIPTPGLLLAYATILVAVHPAITPSFLEGLELIDKDGRVVGYVEIDSGHYLVGEKRRKGAQLAHQHIPLTEETAEIIRDVIDMTRPLREYLKSRGNDDCRRLFVTSYSLGWTPRKWRPTHASRDHSWLEQRFSEVLGLNQQSASRLAKRFSLKKLRSSVAVVAYLETGSVQKMADALGHEKYNPKLLDTYLPAPIQQYFMARWVRIFQCGIICEALKDSPMLLDASGLGTMLQVDEFLNHHCLKRIPAHLEHPEILPGIGEISTPDCVVFGVNPPILTLLVAIERAVASTTRTPGLRAKRWARIAGHLIPHLESQEDQPEFCQMAVIAKRDADPASVMEMIHD